MWRAVLFDNYKLSGILKDRGVDILGKKNIVFNDYISQKERFADLYNGVVFRGRRVVRPEALTTIDSKLWRRGQGGCHEYIRDNVKIWEYRGRRMVLGLEPEASPHLVLPVKYMNYESVQYDRDYKNRMAGHRRRRDLGRDGYISGIAGDERLMPVVTVGIYFGREKWAGAGSMGELTGIDYFPPEIRPFCNDFRVNLVNVGALETEGMFTTDLREVFGFLRRQDDWPELERYVRENEAFRHLKEDAFDVIAACSDSRELAVRKEDFGKGEVFDMCLALKQMEEQAARRGRVEGLAAGRNEGRIEGMLLSVRNLMESTGMEPSEAMRILRIPEIEQPVYIRKLFADD